ncbi:MAG: winged helix-turn-helix domain-containing protein, partial [Anaerolineales bacterium]
QDGSTAIDIVQTSPPDLITLDWMLPRMDGLQVCRGIRRWSKAPILMITSKTGQSDLVAAFDAGVDDYLTKPFEAAEFIARLNALARRREGTPAKDSDHVSIDGLTIDYDSQQVWLAGQHIELTPTEYNLLAYLARHRAQVLTYRQLLEHLYGAEVERSRHDLFVHMSRLRKKIETDPEDPTFIETRWGVGYIFSPG